MDGQIFLKIVEGGVSSNRVAGMAINGSFTIAILQIAYLTDIQQGCQFGGNVYEDMASNFNSGFVVLLYLYGLQFAQFRNIADNNEAGIPQTDEKECDP